MSSSQKSSSKESLDMHKLLDKRKVKGRISQRDTSKARSMFYPFIAKSSQVVQTQFPSPGPISSQNYDSNSEEISSIRVLPNNLSLKNYIIKEDSNLDSPSSDLYEFLNQNIKNPVKLIKKIPQRFSENKHRLPGPGDYENNKMFRIEAKSPRQISLPTSNGEMLFNNPKNNLEMQNYLQGLSQAIKYENEFLRENYIHIKKETQDLLGPGSYNPDITQEKSVAKGVRWSNSNVVRDFMKPSIKKNIGPGSYNVLELKYQKKKSVSNSVFVSNVPKDPIIEKLYSNDCDKLEEIYGKILPGPGYYGNLVPHSTKMQNTRNFYFKSNKQRFEDQKGGIQSTVIGPGYYNITGKNIIEKQSFFQPGFNSFKRRFDYDFEKNNSPGPADYFVKEPKKGFDSYTNQNDPIFISQETNIPKKKIGITPGPGSYDDLESLKLLSKNNSSLNYLFIKNDSHKEDSVSRKHSKDKSQKNTLIPFYSQEFNTINEKINNEKKTKAIIKSGRILENNNYNNCKNLPFNSNIPRFNENGKISNLHSSLNLSTLNYNAPSDFNLASIKNKGNIISSKEERFKMDKTKDPGLSIFYDSGKKSLIKQSYNIMYA